MRARGPRVNRRAFSALSGGRSTWLLWERRPKVPGWLAVVGAGHTSPLRITLATVAERLAAVVWEWPGRGAEHCVLERAEWGYRLAGTAAVAEGGAPYLVEYAVRADTEWRTRSVEVRCNESFLDLSADGAGGWSAGGAEGCIDIDLGFTPSTNTLPIRRAGLALGEALDLDAAWVRFPELTLERLSQRYERLAEDRYVYSSDGFRAELVVDSHGLVVDYEGFWRSIAHD